MAEPFIGRSERRAVPRRLIAGVLVGVVMAAAVAALVSRLGGSAPALPVYMVSTRVLFGVGDDHTKTIDLPAGASDVTVSDDGERIAYMNEGELVVSPAAGAAPDGRPVGWTPDGQLVLEREGAEGRTFLARWPLAGEPQVIVPLGLGSHTGAVVWLSAERFAVALPPREGGDPVLHIISLDTGTPAVDHIVPDAVPLAATEAGVLFIAGDGELSAVAADGTGSRSLGLTIDRATAASHPDGAMAVAGTTEDGPGVWVVRDDGIPTRVLDRPVSAVAWTDADTLVVVTADELLLSVTVPVGAQTQLADGVTEGFLAVVR